MARITTKLSLNTENYNYFILHITLYLFFFQLFKKVKDSKCKTFEIVGYSLGIMKVKATNLLLNRRPCVY